MRENEIAPFYRTLKKASVIIFIMGLFSFLTACGRSKPTEGGLYYTQDAQTSSYSVLKILKVDEGGVHVRMYSNYFSAAPTRIDESTLYLAGIDRKPNETLGMGHLPISKESFSKWNAVFFQQSTVTDDELEGYRMWVDANAGYF